MLKEVGGLPAARRAGRVQVSSETKRLNGRSKSPSERASDAGTVQSICQSEWAIGRGRGWVDDDVCYYLSLSGGRGFPNL